MTTAWSPALAVLDMLDRNPGKTLAELERDLPKTWQSPTMSPHCGDEVKYGVVDRVIAHFKADCRARRRRWRARTSAT